jgi:hypothetical protein
MDELAIALNFEKNRKNFYLVHLPKNCLEQEKEYISEIDFVGRVYNEFSIDEQNEVLDKIRLFKFNLKISGEIIFINKTTCTSGRDIIRHVSCLENIKKRILEDGNI